jgi:hypothetical protein
MPSCPCRVARRVPVNASQTATALPETGAARREPSALKAGVGCSERSTMAGARPSVYEISSGGDSCSDVDHDHAAVEGKQQGRAIAVRAPRRPRMVPP